MGAFKTSAFGGYNKKQVDERIFALESENSSLIASENSLKEQLDSVSESLKSAAGDTGKKYDEIISSNDEKLNTLREENLSLNSEMHRLSEENSELRRKIVKLNADAERNERELREKFGNDYASGISNIGKIYMRAYKSGSEITSDAEEMSQQFLNNIGTVSNGAEAQISAALTRCESIRDEVTALCGYLTKRISQIGDDTGELVEKFRSLSDSFGSADELKISVEAKINKCLADYRKAAAEFVSCASSHAQKPIQSVETVEPEPVKDEPCEEEITQPEIKTEEEEITQPETKTEAVVQQPEPKVAKIENPVETVEAPVQSEPAKEQSVQDAENIKKISVLSEEERKKLIREALMRFSKKQQ